MSSRTDFSNEIIPAIESGLDYWQKWFRESNPLDMGGVDTGAHQVVEQSLQNGRRDRTGIIKPIVDGTRALAFDIAYEDKSLQSFMAAVARIAKNGDTRNLEEFSRETVFMARVAGHLCEMPN